jgi:hypothetical protein
MVPPTKPSNNKRSDGRTDRRSTASRYLRSARPPILLDWKWQGACMAKYLDFALLLNPTSRCPYRAFVRYFRVSFVSGQIVSNHDFHVKSWYSCQIMIFMIFMSNHVFMSNYDIHVKSRHSCQIMSFISNHVIHVKSCHSCHHSWHSWH